MTTDQQFTPVLSAPEWFTNALAVPYTNEFITVAGARIHYLAWGETGRPGLVFVHGGGAHAHWWTHIAAQFAADYRVIAIDLSGHGDSDHRSHEGENPYGLNLWTDEVIAAIESSGMVVPAVVIGHSMGGFVTVATAARYPNHLRGAIVCDSPVAEPDPEITPIRQRDIFGRERVYDSREEALKRFRTVPRQEHYLDYVMEHVGFQSLGKVETEEGHGYRWKFDRSIFSGFDQPIRVISLPYLKDVQCRLSLLRSENGLVTRDIGNAMYERLGRVAPVIEIPEAGHHAMLDQPLLLLVTIRALIADWEHSDPHRRRD